MQTTQELVTLIQSEFAQNVGRNRILSYIDRAQKEMFNQNLFQNIFINRSDTVFPWPILNTTAGTLSYELNGTTLLDSSGNPITLAIVDVDGTSRNIAIRKAIHVFIMVNSIATSNYNKKFYGDRINLQGVNYYWSQQAFKTDFYNVPLAENIEKSNLQNARITFGEDPGTSNDQYYVEAYYGPVDLVSESIPMTVSLDRWQEAIIDGVNGYIEQWKNGRTDKLIEFRKYWLPKFRSMMNDGSNQKKPLQIPVRDCG